MLQLHVNQIVQTTSLGIEEPYITHDLFNLSIEPYKTGTQNILKLSVYSRKQHKNNNSTKEMISYFLYVFLLCNIMKIRI